MIKTVTTVRVDGKLALKCLVTNRVQYQMDKAKVEAAFVQYEGQTPSGFRIILLQGENSRDAAMAAWRKNLLDRFDAIALFTPGSGFRVAYARTGAPFQQGYAFNRTTRKTLPPPPVAKESK